MKKFWAMMMAMMMAFSMAACGGGEEAPVEEPAALETIVAEAGDGGADGFTLWDCELLDVPALEGTAWSFCGGYMNDVELTQEEFDAIMEMYGGTLQFVLNEDGTAEMVQGGGSLYGEYQYMSNGASMTFDNNGEALHYDMIFIDLDGVTMIAMTDTTGENGLYFAQ